MAQHLARSTILSLSLSLSRFLSQAVHEEIFGYNLTELIGPYCCAQFIASRGAIQSHDHHFYTRTPGSALIRCRCAKPASCQWQDGPRRPWSITIGKPWQTFEDLPDLLVFLPM